MQVWRTDLNVAYEQYTTPFGEVYASYTNTSEWMGVMRGQNIGLPGNIHDTESGYDYNWMRTRDASTGYTQPDRLDVLARTNDPELLMAQGMGVLRLPYRMHNNHLYAYVGGNPINRYDFYGLDFWDDAKNNLDGQCLVNCQDFMSPWTDDFPDSIPEEYNPGDKSKAFGAAVCIIYAYLCETPKPYESTPPPEMPEPFMCPKDDSNPLFPSGPRFEPM